MNYGRFFVLDLEASDITQGISVFNYRGVKYLKDDDRCENDTATPTYPIYLSFTPQGVFFYVHFAIKNEEKVSPPIIHQNSLILSLPLSSNFEIRDHLTVCLNDIFRTAFPINMENNYLYDIIDQHIISSEDLGKDITYSSLEIFGINYQKPKNQSRPPIIGFIRKLFLDFLYDLEHTTVFENASVYDQVYIGLHENFLFNAIANKAEYYYQRKQQTKTVATHYPWDRAEQQLFYADFFSKAEQKWIETITNPKADRCFFESGWFSNVESEMNQLYLSGSVKYPLPLPKEARPQAIESQKTKCCIEFVSDIAIKKENSHNCRANIKSEKKIKTTLRSSAKLASNWYIKKYCFSGTTRIWYGNHYKWIKGLIALFIFSLCAMLLAPSFQEGIFSDQTIPPLCVIGGAIVLWIIGLFNYKKWYIRGIGCINILMPRLLASIIAAWFTLAIGEDIFKGFFDNKHQLWVSVGLLIILIIFVYYEIGKINPYIGISKRILRSSMLMLVAFSYAFIVGILVINFFGGKYLERSDYIDEFYVNSVYTSIPDFGVDDCDQPQLVHGIFYEILKKYEPKLIHSLVKSKQDTLITSKLDQLYAQVPLNLCLKLPVTFASDPRKPRIDSIDYRLTLLLVNEFIKEDSIPLNRMHERMFEGSTIKSRVNHVVSFYNNLKHIPDSILPPINFSVYSETWINLLKSIDNHQVYRKVLKYLKPLNNNHRHRILTITKTGIWIFRDMLLQFTFFAMFIGIFIQLIFEEKPITEPV